MQIQDGAVWDRMFPVRYLLVREDADGGEELWGRCAGVEGLFVDPAPPPREVLTLRGCDPSGALHDAVARTGRAPRLLGDVCVEVWDGQRPVQWWNLVDAVVIAHRPNRADPALADVIVGAGVQVDWPGATPAAPRFELFGGTTADARPVGRCLSVDGLFARRADSPKAPVQLIGCEPAAPLLAALRGPRRWERDWARLCALDRDGRVMHCIGVRLDVLRTRPSVLEGALIDITFADGADRPPLLARPMWETWYQGIPDTLNLWAPYPARGRSAWLDLARSTLATGRRDRSGGVYHLDGRFVTDKPGLYCAMGEALVGPGGYFGWGWDAFADCLCGGFGLIPPFTLIWHDADVARHALADAVLDPDTGLSYFEEVLHLLESSGVTVVLR